MESDSERLPREIQDLVLSQLIDDPRNTLLICSLVCQRWLDQSRKLFWSTSPLVLQSSNCINYGPLIDKIKEGRCGFLPYIRILSVSGEETEAYDNKNFDSVIPAIVPRIRSQLKSLMLQNIEIHLLSPLTRESLMLLHSVESLECDMVECDDVALFCRFFSSFEKLRKFSLANMDSSNLTEAEAGMVEPIYADLQSFKVDIHPESMSAYVIAGVVASPCRLQVLHLDWMSQPQWNVVNSLLKHAGSFLQELSTGIANAAAELELENQDDPDFKLVLPVMLEHRRVWSRDISHDIT